MKLYDHQITALQLSEGLERVAYFLEMGLGKTYVGSEAMMRFGRDANLLVCQKSKIADWMEHFQTNYSGYIIYDLTKRGQLDKFLAGGKRVGIINYELAWRRKELLSLSNFCLMLDESSLIQNRKAKQTKFILKMQPANVILLSGTPTSGKYENLWTQAHLLGWDIAERTYQQQYVNWTKLRIPGGQIVNVVDKTNPYKNVDRLKRKLREHGAQFLKTEEVMGLPEQNFVTISVPASKNYRTFMERSVLEIDGVELVGDTSLNKRMYARQLCGVYSKEKLESFKALVESTNDRLVVFYNFTAELEAMLKCVPLDRPCDVINGKHKCLDAYENNDDAIVFVQYQAGAMGINLQKANKIVYYTPPERCELWMQSQKRIHRIGQNRACFYYKLICKNSVEEQIYDALGRGVDFTDELFKEGQK